MSKEFTREELESIRDKASDEARIPNLNPLWAEAYKALAAETDADYLDAMLARTEEKE